MRSKKQALLNSVLSLVLCISMLLGTTFAWFTDEVTSENNIIKSGTLDVEMFWKNPGESDEAWKNAKEGAIFNYAYWEPGYVEAKCLKVANVGDLAFQYRLFVVPNNDVAAGMKLAEVLDVYVSTTEITGRGDIANMTRLGTLKELMANPNGVDDGVLLPAADKGAKDDVVEPAGEYYTGEVAVCIALKMQETAGNEYMNLNLGDGFKVQLLATQYTYEKDSFGADYDTDSVWPEGGYTGNGGTSSAPSVNAASGTANVNVDGDGKTTEATTIETNNADVKATLPEGVKMADGATSANFSVTPKVVTDSNVTTSDSQSMTSLDVHVAGVSADNTKPIIVELGKMLDIGLNLGNVLLFHVEKGETVEMTQVTTLAELDEHNEFYYDPATGFVTVAMATFSEIAVVAEPAKWNGTRDYTWYDAAKTELTIANADQLAAFGAIVGGMAKTADGVDIAQDSFKGKTVKMICDIVIGDLTDEDGRNVVFYPIGYYNDEGTYEKSNKAISSAFRKFEGTFDGNGHTISDFYQNTWEMKGDHNWYPAEEQRYRDGMGLFGKVYGGTVKNLTVRNFSSDGEITTTGTIAAYADCGATFENIAIFNCNPRVYNIGNGGIVGCVGWYANDNVANPVKFKNITVDNTNKISALWGSWDVPCGGLVGQYYPTSGQENAIVNKGIHMENCHVAAQIDVNNDVCANYQYYAYRYAGILIGSVRENVTQNGREYPKMDGITAENCTVHFGDWNDYYYCELVANSLASYTHDYQMSRLTQVKSVVGNTVTYLDGTVKTITGTANFVVVDGKHATENATCYHFVDGAVWEHKDAGTEIVDEVEVLKEDKQHLYLEFNNLVTGYGWGVTSKGVDDMQGVEILDKSMDGGSVTKFEKAETAQDAYTSTVTVNIGDLFAAIANAGVAIKGDQVHVTVSPVVGTTSTAGGEYTANATDWTKGTLKFTGTGAAAITISDYYFCKTTTIYVNILPVVPTMVAVANAKTTFSKGDTFSKGENFIAIAALSNGDTKDVTTEVNVSGFDSAEAGVTIITVSYELNGKTVSTTYEVRVIAPVRIKVDVLKNKFNIGAKLTTQDFKVTAYSSDGTSTTVNNFNISTVDMNTVGTKTVTITDPANNLTATVAIEVMNLTLLEIDYTAQYQVYDTWTEDYHRMWWFGTGNYDVAGWKPYPEFGATIPAGKTDTGANGETITGFENNWAGIQNTHNDYSNSGVSHSNDFKNNNNWYGLTVNDAVPYTTLGINCVVGYDAYMLGFGYYINGDVATLKYNEPATRYTTDTTYGKYAAHAYTQFTCYDFEPGQQYTVTWVAVFEDGIQKISDWTINMKAASASDAVYKETDKPNVNVILMAGQSNMFGASPLTQDTIDQYAGTDFSNVFIHYANINFDENNNLKTYFSNDGFDMYTLGIGGQGNTYFGPELALAYDLATNGELNGEQWYIIKYAAAGTGLTAQWTNNCIVDGKTTTLTNDMLAYFQSAIDELDQKYDVKVRSFMWMQGETDAVWKANSEAYAAAEKNLVNRVRETFGAYATRAATASSTIGSGISFVNAGIAINDTDYTTAEGGPNDWIYAEIVNAGKVSNSQWVCSTQAENEDFKPANGPLTHVTFKTTDEAGVDHYAPTVKNPDESKAIVNSIFMDTHHLLSKANSIDEHAQYSVEGDKTDWAHYGAEAMEILGGFFASGMHFLINQNG